MSPFREPDMGINSGGGDGGIVRRKIRHRKIEKGQPPKPFLPVENPFPSKEEFRLGTYQIVQELDDYLLCKGYDPQAKNPFGQYTPAAHKTVTIAKPPLLQKTPWDGETIEIGGTEYTYAYDASEIGLRTVTWTDDDDVEQEETQRIDTGYFVDDTIVALEVSKNQWQDGLEVNEWKVVDGNGAILSWVDLNVSGRKWKVDCGECLYSWEFEISGGNPSSGSQVWSVVLNADTQNVTVDYNETAASLKTHLLAQFSGLATADVETEGGPLPEVPITVTWKNDFANYASDDWPVTVGTNTLNNEGWMKVRQINPR